MGLLHAIAAAGVLFVMLLSFIAPMNSVSAAQQNSHHSHPMIVAGSYTSTNWSGYAVTGSAGSVTAAYGSWTVPDVSCPSGTTSYSSSWVGIDGFSDSTVEQVGTDSDCQSGAPTYYAWYEFYPSPAYLVGGMNVSPGDVISASVTSSGKTFTVTITDLTSGQPSFSTSSRVSSAQRESAEWILEAPSSASTGSILPLANFGTDYFGDDYTYASSTNYATVGGVTGQLGTFGSAVQSITMVSGSGTTEAQPSAVSSDGTSFDVTYAGGTTTTSSTTASTTTSTLTSTSSHTSTTSATTSTSSSSSTLSSSTTSSRSTTTSTSSTSSSSGTAATLTVNSQNTLGATITGYYVVLYDSNGNTGGTGYTPKTFSVTTGKAYQVEVNSYGSCHFAYWADTGSTSNPRSITITGNTVLTAIYNCGGTTTTTSSTTTSTQTTTITSTSTSSQSASLTIQSVDQSGATITGYYTTLYYGGSAVSSKYTPALFSGLAAGQPYSVEVNGYGSCSFNHWQDTGDTDATRTFTAGGAQSFTAVYDCTGTGGPADQARVNLGPLSTQNDETQILLSLLTIASAIGMSRLGNAIVLKFPSGPAR